MQQDNRNTIIFLVCALALFMAYQFLVLEPNAKRQQAEAKAKAAASAPATAPAAPGAANPGVVEVPREQAIANGGARVQIATPALKGTMSLTGARIDDLFLSGYPQSVAKDSPPVELLRPEGVGYAWYATFGWRGDNVPGLPGKDTVWTLAQGSTLAPGQPVVLTTTNGMGLTFTRKVEVDDKFMFTITDTVANGGAAPLSLAHYGSVERHGVPKTTGTNSIVHEGAIGALGDPKPTLKLVKYKDWAKKGGGGEMASAGGWIGITDKYWLTALVPQQDERVAGQFFQKKTGVRDDFAASYQGPSRAIGPGEQISETTRLFAGAKTVPVLQGYQKAFGIPRFDDAVDWGRLWFLTRPIFAFLELIFRQVGTFGIAILLLTVTVRLLFFPIANKQYESMTKMKKVQPQMEELRKKFKDDPAKQQQEMLALYQREKVNPVAGCVPILLQIPVFYALYKVLTVTIEMRHAPFMGWIKDLSAPDPTNIWNLFGLIPWDPASVPLIGGFIGSTAAQHGMLALGVLPILYGCTMWLTTAMSPPAPDPTQQRIFQLMPIIFTFIMAPFAVGLLIYWTWSNVLTTLQQYVIMRRFKVDNPIDRVIRKITGKPAPAS